MKTRFAFIGFQHPHIWDLVARAAAHPAIEVVAMCEEDAALREKLAGDPRVRLTHSDYRAMLAAVACDAVVVGEWFGKRGRVVCDCLRAGRHVLADKPMCTALAELDEITRLAAERRLTVGLMLDLRDAGVFRTVHALVRGGEIGEVRAASLEAQHPLLTGVRAAWYYEAGRHGGTLNDLAIHGLDLIAWLTGRQVRRITAARCWAAGVPADSPFQNAGQLMAELDNGAGLLADVSYVSPDSHRYSLPMYWRLTLWGGRGALVAALNAPEIMLFKEGEQTGRALPVGPASPGGYLEAFLREMRGEPNDGLTAAEIFRASRAALLAQQAADHGQCRVEL